MYFAEGTECYRAVEGRGGESRGHVRGKGGWSNESFHVPVLQRNDDGKREVVRLAKRRRDGRIGQYWKALSWWEDGVLMLDKGV